MAQELEEDGMIHWKPGITLDEVKVQVIRLALKHFKGNKTHAAASLGVSIRAMRYWVNQSQKLKRFRVEI